MADVAKPLAGQVALVAGATRGAGRGIAFVAIIATIMILLQLLMIPTYLMFARIGIVDTLAAAFVPWLASAFGRAAGAERLIVPGNCGPPPVRGCERMP